MTHSAEAQLDIVDRQACGTLAGVSRACGQLNRSMVRLKEAVVDQMHGLDRTERKEPMRAAPAHCGPVWKSPPGRYPGAGHFLAGVKKRRVQPLP
jgi:hypothetical protein